MCSSSSRKKSHRCLRFNFSGKHLTVTSGIWIVMFMSLPHSLLRLLQYSELDQTLEFFLRIARQMPQEIPGISNQSYKICFVPATFGHSRRETAQEPESLNIAGSR